MSTNTANAGVYDIRFLGYNVWSSPNNMVSKNHMYTWDRDLNVTFPAKITATSFLGNATSATSATKATQDSDGNTINTTYAKLSGATFTGAINTANGTWNTIGDDAYLGDINKGGHIGIKGKNGNTGLFFVTYN